MGEGSRRPAKPAADDFVKIADAFERREFGPGELSAVKKTLRRSPRADNAKTEVQNAKHRLELVALLSEPGRYDIDALDGAWGGDD